ncbi:MAG TPA: alpha/beta hydrolase [Verrucomicrobiae bacterium]
MYFRFLLVFLSGFFLLLASAPAAEPGPQYLVRTNLVYGRVGEMDLLLNAFLPAGATSAVPCIVDIHGGWWQGGGRAERLEGVGGWQWFRRHGLAVFSIDYRLGRQGGFPENIRDCRNAIRYLRLHAAEFNIDPERIEVTGGSAGGHLSLMVAMVPEDFPDGGPLPELAGVSAHVAGSFSFIPPTDFVRFWQQGPEDAMTNANGQVTYRGPDNKIPADSRPHLRTLFHGITPDSPAHVELYRQMCPLGQVRPGLPPLLICDGEVDPIVPGLHGQALYTALQAAGAKATYWLSPQGGHAFPSGPGFDQVLDQFLVASLKLPVVSHE